MANFASSEAHIILSSRLEQSIQLGFIFACIHVTTFLSNSYQTEFSKNLAELNVETV